MLERFQSATVILINNTYSLYINITLLAIYLEKQQQQQQHNQHIQAMLALSNTA